MEPDPPLREAAAARAKRLAVGAAVHVVDDDEAVRRAFGLLLRTAGLSLVLHDSAEAFLDALSHGTGPIACVLIDLCMPGIDGIGLVKRLREAGFASPVILVTARGNVPVAVRAMKEGADDIIEKPFNDEQLFEAIAAALGCPAEARPSDTGSGARDAARARLATLSPREHQVLALLAGGRANKEVARLLGLSPRTVEIHRARMMARLGVRSFAEAVGLSVQAAAPFAGEGGGPAPSHVAYRDALR